MNVVSHYVQFVNLTPRSVLRNGNFFRSQKKKKAIKGVGCFHEKLTYIYKHSQRFQLLISLEKCQ